LTQKEAIEPVGGIERVFDEEPDVAALPRFLGQVGDVL